MRKQPSKGLEAGRVISGPFATTSDAGMTGAFFIKTATKDRLRIIASDGVISFGWDHVSVSLDHRCPTWNEMSLVKELFWDDDEEVFQFHPPKSMHINFHKYCLHLWRPINGGILLPPPILVGPPNAGP